MEDNIFRRREAEDFRKTIKTEENYSQVKSLQSMQETEMQAGKNKLQNWFTSIFSREEQNTKVKGTAETSEQELSGLNWFSKMWKKCTVYVKNLFSFNFGKKEVKKEDEPISNSWDEDLEVIEKKSDQVEKEKLSLEQKYSGGRRGYRIDPNDLKGALENYNKANINEKIVDSREKDVETIIEKKSDQVEEEKLGSEQKYPGRRRQWNIDPNEVKGVLENYNKANINEKIVDSREKDVETVIEKKLDQVEEEKLGFRKKNPRRWDTAYSQLSGLLSVTKENVYEHQNGNLEEEKREADIDETKIKKIEHHLPARYITSDIKMEDVSKEPLFLHKPELNDIIQGNLGDCYLLASLGSIVQKDPHDILNIMKDNGDGTVSVRFYDQKNHQLVVKVKKEIPKYRGEDLYAKNCLWVQMIEKAYAISGLSKKRTEDTYSYGDIIGGCAYEFMRHIYGAKTRLYFTGGDFSFDLENANIISLEERQEGREKAAHDAELKREKNIFAKVTSFLHKGKDVDKMYSSYTERVFAKVSSTLQKGIAVANTRQVQGNDQGLNGEAMSDGLVWKHAYTITGVEEEKRGRHTYKFIRMRNPWGEYGKADEFDEKTKQFRSKADWSKGEFRIELNEFMDSIARIDLL